MAQTVSVVLCAAIVAVFWASIGLPIALRLAPRSVVAYLAPAFGWAIHSALALPVFSIVGMGRPTVLLTSVMALVASIAAVRLRRSDILTDRVSWVTVAAVVGAALLAMTLAAAVLPKATVDGVTLAAPIFDHSKVALIDEMIRFGVPPVNPFFGEIGTTDRVAYYYLWHFSAAVAGLATNASGWEADAALTWFTAFASLLLMMGIAVWLSERRWSAIIVLLVAATSSLRVPLDWVVGRDAARFAIQDGTGFGGWLFQTSWAPQHTAAAACVVLACVLLPRLGESRGPFLPVVVGLLAAAGFQSSVWVGGVTFGVAALFIILHDVWHLDSSRTRSFLVQVGLAAVVAGAFSSSFLIDQIVMAGLREGGVPIVVRPVHVLGSGIVAQLRPLLDLPAYWLLYLPAELPAYYPVGLLGIVAIAAGRSAEEPRGPLRPLVLLLVASLIVAWLMVSTVGSNNDLGWRAILPAALLLVAFAAAGVSIRLAAGAPRMAIVAAVGFLLGLPEGLAIIKENLRAQPAKSEQVFAASPELWSAVRRQMSPTERLANNPLFLADLTPWPINISWALLADRRSCFAGADLALPFAPIPKARRAELDKQFTRVFAGEAGPADVEQLAKRYDCAVAVVTAQDGAWSNDPFASTPHYRLADSRPDAWRIYRRTTPQGP
jgi:hypothetical protein